MHEAVPPTAAPRGQRLIAGEIVLDAAAHLVTVHGRAVPLALQEFRLLELLMTRADTVVPSTEILDSLWGQGYIDDSGTLPVHMLRLRRKLDRWPGSSQHLRTVRGIGYVFDTVPVTEE